MTRPFLYPPAGQWVMCGWSQTGPLRTFSIPTIFCQQASLLDNILFMSSINLYTFAYAEPWARPQDDSNCWWASEALPPSAQRAIEQQTSNHMWQYEKRRPEEGAARGVNRLWQQHWLTSAHLQEQQLFISAKILQQPGDSVEMKQSGEQR